MNELSESDFERLCRAPAVQAALATMEERRRRAVLRFWLFLAGGTALTVAYMWPLIATGHDLMALPGPIFWLVCVIVALVQIGRWNADLRQPVLETLAAIAGVEHRAKGFDPPVYPAARSPLFGDTLVGQVFTDLLQGRDEQGARVSFYQAMLNRPGSRSAVTVFYGQIYAFERRSNYPAYTVVRPDQGVFNFIGPGGAERVRFGADAAFEAKFEVYSTNPATALAQLGDELRRTLLELRVTGRVFAYLSPEGALVAVAAKVRFEAGNMFRRVPAERRVRHMFDEVRESLATLRRLGRALG